MKERQGITILLLCLIDDGRLFCIRGCGKILSANLYVQLLTHRYAHIHISLSKPALTFPEYVIASICTNHTHVCLCQMREHSVINGD